MEEPIDSAWKDPGEYDQDGRRFSTQEEIDAAIASLKERGEWPEVSERQVATRALYSRRRSALSAEGIVTRPIWL